MKVDWQYLRKVLLWYVCITGGALGLLAFLLPGPSIASTVAGSIMSLLNFLSGFLAIEFAFEKSHTTFLKVVLGGMVIRLLVMTGAVLVLLEVFDLNALGLMLALLGYYVLNLVFEIVFLQKKVALKQP